MGQSNVWYADSPSMIDFKKEVLILIKIYEKKKISRSRTSTFRQPDVELRKKIENIAIKEVIKEYSGRGFSVKSVERENLGWDLEAVHKKRKLKIEVKGLSGHNLSVELTPNEFSKMNNNKDTYRLCVVTNCLESPTLYVFLYSFEKNEWVSEDGHILSINQIISARCYT